ncbi:TlpA family protein disulfide reductase [Micromonospora sediminimaris]|uniref:Thiol:disulfide interchange protein n=1 Tax=Micromonospora sediminimaris TaxID=547162 RepID=A0A9W5UUL0_9ACTN|nr:redoxin domain-containing protein [Micromonospora sediminimaris]GIJ34663.1 thiol:disulfide interchange protein [Micromonospora sediminimaris]SFB82680.1 Thiol-disulfide isomerase or thioredoxin [Micromonospora sediminimaris]
MGSVPRTGRVTGAVTAALLAAVLATAGCGTGPDAEAAPQAGGPASATASSPSTGPVPDTLRFTGTTLDGAAFDAATLAGRPVVLWFWAPWCATCASQAWTIAEIEPGFRETVPIIGVAGLGERKAMTDFVTEFELGPMPQIEDREGVIWRRFEVVEQSTFVIIDRDGRIIHQGWLDGEDLTRRVTALAT